MKDQHKRTYASAVQSTKAGKGSNTKNHPAKATRCRSLPRHALDVDHSACTSRLNQYAEQVSALQERLELAKQETQMHEKMAQLAARTNETLRQNAILQASKAMGAAEQIHSLRTRLFKYEVAANRFRAATDPSTLQTDHLSTLHFDPFLPSSASASP
jgi:beta-glucosidase-like glycosyl hydrolase